MFRLIRNDRNKIEIEKEIMNSNEEYNVIAFDKKHLEDEDILKGHRLAEELNVERFLVKKGEEYIGILDYGMSSPTHKSPRISLLVVHKEYQGLGYAKEIYKVYERLMEEKKVSSIHIAVHSTNKKALHFWTSLGFVKFNERIYEGKEIYSFEKKLIKLGELN
ncbi:GNAT family N-acetyltransferase [Bacillaceae bacterium S4-13-56]